MMKKLLLSLCAVLFSLQLIAQDSKPPLDFSVYDIWNRLGSTKISENGQIVTYEINPAIGDGNFFIKDLKLNKEFSFPRGRSGVISPESDFVVFRIKAQADTVRQAKLKKVKSDKMPKDTLALFDMNELRTWEPLKSFKVPSKGRGV